MRKGSAILTITFSAVLISSCATDRLQVARRQAVECKIPETRYTAARHKPVKSFWSLHQMRNSDLNQASLKKSNKAYLANRSKNRDQDVVVPGSFMEASRNADLLAPENISVPGLFNYELSKLRGPAVSVNELPEASGSETNDNLIFTPASQENLSGMPVISVNSEAKEGTSVNSAPPETNTPVLPGQKSEIFILLLSLLAGIVPYSVIRSNPGLANDISFWAASNPWKTRIMFTVAQAALGTTGYFLGQKLAGEGMHFSSLPRDIFIATFMTSALFYPVKGSSNMVFKHTYFKQRAFNLALAVSGFMLIMNAGNDPAMLTSFNKLARHNSQSTLIAGTESNPTPDHLLYIQNPQQLQEQPVVSQKKEMSNDTKSLLIFLLVLGIVAVGVGAAAGACALSCNGMTGLAVLTAIGGVGLIILGILGIKRVAHPSSRSRTKPSKYTDPVSANSRRTFQV